MKDSSYLFGPGDPIRPHIAGISIEYDRPIDLS